MIGKFINPIGNPIGIFFYRKKNSILSTKHFFAVSYRFFLEGKEVVVCVIFWVCFYHGKESFQQFSSRKNVGNSSMCLSIDDTIMGTKITQTFTGKMRDKSICKFSRT